MTIEEIKELLKDNQDAVSALEDVVKTRDDLTDRVQFLEKEAKTAFEKRDQTRQELSRIKETLGLDEINEENLKKLKSKDQNPELDNLKKQLEEAAKMKDQVLSEFEQYKQNVALERVVTEAGVEANVANPKMFEIVKNLLLEGAKVMPDGTVAYVNPDGTTVYRDGKPLSVSDRLNEMKESDDYAGLFKPIVAGGSGSKPTTAAPVGSVDVASMSKAEKAALIAKVGSEKYLEMARQSQSKEQTE
ncbi:MAG: hypothetical protein L3J47_12495 [Sulfurovum sp.]|nr:hypothetical protein [Sulfurovum sp.]